MPKSIEFCQLVARGIGGNGWIVPRIRDSDRWRNIHNSQLVTNPTAINGYDRYENSIFRIQEIMEDHGWSTEISDSKVQCHEHLIYQHYRLKCHK